MEVCRSFKDVSSRILDFRIRFCTNAEYMPQNKNFPLYITGEIRNIYFYSLLEVFYIALTQQNWQTLELSNAVQPIWAVEIDCRPVCTCFSVNS